MRHLEFIVAFISQSPLQQTKLKKVGLLQRSQEIQDSIMGVLHYSRPLMEKTEQDLSSQSLLIKKTQFLSDTAPISEILLV